MRSVVTLMVMLLGTSAFAEGIDCPQLGIEITFSDLNPLARKTFVGRDQDRLDNFWSENPEVTSVTFISIESELIIRLHPDEEIKFLVIPLEETTHTIVLDDISDAECSKNT